MSVSTATSKRAWLNGYFASFSAKVSLLIAATVLIVFAVSVAVMASQSVKNGSVQAARLILVSLNALDQLPADASMLQSELLIRNSAPESAARLPPMARQLQGVLADRIGAQRVRITTGSGTDDRRLFYVWLRSSNAIERWYGLPMEPQAGRISTMTMTALILTVLMVCVAAWWLTRLLIRPIEMLTLQAPAIVAGRDVPTVVGYAAPEVHSLAQALRQAAQAQAQIARERELMLVGISHDLRTPIARLRMALELDSGDDRQLILADVLELEDVVSGFLSTARAEIDEPHSEIDLTTLLTALMASRAADWKLLADEPIKTKLPVASFKRVLGNLLDNAELHGQAPRAVRLGRAHGWIFVDVDNAGAAIPGDIQRDPLRPFKASASGHTGMGLAIAARLASRFSGTLEFRDGPNTVSVRLKWPS
jgi:two-component system, OmpR family, osmolarity sensor histidine kinase EnvZ